MPNKKAQKIRDFLGHVLEPIALGVLALLFIIPTITVMNLSPITKKLQELNVLGASTKSSVSVVLVGGTHDIFTSESLAKDNNDSNIYEYSANISKRGADSYSKPIIQIQNNTDKSQTVSFYGQTGESTQSNINLIVNNQNYQIEDTKGQTYLQQITLNPAEKATIFLAIESVTGIQFSESFNMQVKVLEQL